MALLKRPFDPARRTPVQCDHPTAPISSPLELWGTDDTGDRQLASSSTRNSGASLHAMIATPEIDVRTAPCLLWTRVFVAIRWTDNMLSNVSFDMPIGYFNLDEHCLAAPPPPTTTTTTTTIPTTTTTTIP